MVLRSKDQILTWQIPGTEQKNSGNPVSYISLSLFRKKNTSRIPITRFPFIPHWLELAPIPILQPFTSKGEWVIHNPAEPICWDSGKDSFFLEHMIIWYLNRMAVVLARKRRDVAIGSNWLCLLSWFLKWQHGSVELTPLETCLLRSYKWKNMV